MAESGIPPLYWCTAHYVEMLLKAEVPLVHSAFRMCGFTPSQVWRWDASHQKLTLECVPSLIWIEVAGTLFFLNEQWSRQRQEAGLSMSFCIVTFSKRWEEQGLPLWFLFMQSHIITTSPEMTKRFISNNNSTDIKNKDLNTKTRLVWLMTCNSYFLSFLCSKHIIFKSDI